MAFIRINQIKDADGSIEPDELELANDIIESMLITRKGSIPGSRGFGLTQIFIDMPGPDAINMITVELAEAMDEYIPSLELQDVKGTQDEEGVLELDIYIGRRKKSMAIEQIERLPDVSFIDDDINLDGIQKQMLQDYQDKYMEETGEETVLDRGEPIALILYACSVQIYQMYMYVDRAGKQNLLKYAFGAFLDNLAALKGIERTAAKPATVTIRFTLSEAQTGATAIPAGTRVTDGEVYFTTDEYAEIKAGETTVDVACTSIETGADLNGIQEGAIQTLVDPIPYIESVTNITETDGGADPESDESLKDRIYIAPSRYSTAGTEEAYVYWVKTYNSTIADVKVSSDNPGEVDIVFLMDDGIPSQEIITGLTKYITDPNIRPLTDKVVVKAPTAVNYSISLTYYINSSDSGSVATIQSEVAKAVDDFVTWQQSKIGRDINSSELIKRVTAAGAKRVEIKSPVFQKIGGTSIAYCTSKNVTYGGVEDD